MALPSAVPPQSRPEAINRSFSHFEQLKLREIGKNNREIGEKKGAKQLKLFAKGSRTTERICT